MPEETEKPAACKPDVTDKDAPRKEIVLYAVGNIEGGIANQFYSILNTVTVVALGLNPMIMGLIISLKTLWDAITDPVMAQITDNARTRWGRRIPFILGGGVTRVLFLVAVFAFFPQSPDTKTNAEFKRLEDQNIAQAAKEAEAAEQAEAAAETQATEQTAEGTVLAQPSTADSADSAGSEETAATPPAPKTKPSFSEQISAGIKIFFTNEEDPYARTVAIYLLVASLIFTLLSTVQSVPYYALGIELAPSYDGRTRVVVYRAFVDKAMSLVSPWILPFIFLPIFVTAIDGLLWYAILVCVVGIPTTVAMCMVVKERGFNPNLKRPPAPPLFKSMWLTTKNIHFLKILFLYVFIGLTNGMFNQVGSFLVLFYVFDGNIVQGGIVNGYASVLAVILGFVSLPLINWASQRIGKHRTLRWAIIWMSVGSVLKWFCINPDYPYLLLVLPFFFSIGISSVFTLLPTMMADVTDVDELNNGVRREGMFGAVMAFLTKALTSFQPVLAAAVLLASGFFAPAGAEQDPEVFLNMRLMASIIPGILLLFALSVLIKYPLTRERMDEIKQELADRRLKMQAE